MTEYGSGENLLLHPRSSGAFFALGNGAAVGK